ncbi:hypothetical protein HDU83_000756 [Entophlyctis luteolus]|nr:hypothetical protein HDU83_000756 [Entophlyctis luteolus]
MLVLSRVGLGPKLYGRFRNGLVYGYFDGEPFTVEDMRDPHKSSLTAKHLAKWHQVEAGDVMEKKPKLFDTLELWLNTIPAKFTKPEAETSFRSFMSVGRLRNEVNTLKAALGEVDSLVVFSHCDLLTGNIIYNAAQDKVDFIDYEYGSYNFRGFDIGNHFCEHAGFDCDWDLYPSKSFQYKWLRDYLSEYFQDASVVTAEMVDKLYAEVNKYALASHLYWGIWALVQAEISDLDFDYAGYSKMRIDEYFRRRDEFLKL